MAPGRSCLTPNGLGVLLDTELTEPADRRLPARLRRQAAVKPGPAGAVKQPVRFERSAAGEGRTLRYAGGSAPAARPKTTCH